jgi:aminoglycoside 6'-N-acetyltransferase I
MTARIVDLPTARSGLIDQTARLLYDSFRDLTPAWPDIESARDEVLASLQEGKISRVMLNHARDVIGWIGAQPQYEGRVWELHPLVVAASMRRVGYGRALVLDIEATVAARGALTLWVGSDDETNATSLSGIDLYDDLPGAIRNVRNLKNHPYEFYIRLGFQIVGVMPDANGLGKPDIYLAKRVAK